MSPSVTLHPLQPAPTFSFSSFHTWHGILFNFMGTLGHLFGVTDSFVCRDGLSLGRVNSRPTGSGPDYLREESVPSLFPLETTPSFILEISVQIPYIPEFLAWVLSKPHVLWVSLIPASRYPVPSLDWRWNAGTSHILLLMASLFPSHSYGCFPPSLCPEIQHDSWCLHCMQISVGFPLLGQTPLDCLLFSKMLCISLSAMAGSPTLVPVGLDCDFSSPVVQGDLGQEQEQAQICAIYFVTHGAKCSLVSTRSSGSMRW